MEQQPTSVEGLSAYLDARSIKHTNVDELSGGTANYVFRVFKSDGSTIVAKHAEPFVKSNPSMAFPVDRMKHEANAISLVPSYVTQTDLKVAAPVLHEYDKQYHVLLMSDGGSETLKDAYADPSLNIAAIGTQLGLWLARLHSSTQTVETEDNTIARDIYRYSYNNVHLSLEKNGLKADLGHTINERYGSLLKTDNECICHGDFWTGNILLSKDPQDESIPKMTVVDWEITRRGCGATDIGQFAAEAWLLDRFRDQDRGLRAAFLKSYLESAKPTDRFLERAAVHFGCHIAFWPTHVKWADAEQTKEVVAIGAKVMEEALEGSRESILRSEFLKGAM